MCMAAFIVFFVCVVKIMIGIAFVRRRTVVKKLVANEIDVVQNNCCEYFYVYRFLKTAMSWNCVYVTFQARNNSL